MLPHYWNSFRGNVVILKKKRRCFKYSKIQLVPQISAFASGWEKMRWYEWLMGRCEKCQDVCVIRGVILLWIGCKSVCECQVSEWAIKDIWTRGIEMGRISKCDWNDAPSDHFTPEMCFIEMKCFVSFRFTQQEFSQEILFPKIHLWNWKTWWIFSENKPDGLWWILIEPLTYLPVNLGCNLKQN